MNIQNIVRASAQIIRITDLQKGNVVKYIEESTYGGPEVYYGIITDILADETKTFIEIVTYKKSYGDVKVDTKIFNGEKDLALFPATPNEVEEYFDQIKEGVQSEIDKLSHELKKKVTAYENLTQLLKNSSVGLTATPFVEVEAGDANETLS